MSASNITLFFGIMIVSGSYGWAVRGTTLGKENGAMLPGAMLGILMAFFSGSALLQEHFWLFGAAGALSMFVGGCETYAQTMDLVLKTKVSAQIRRGITGLMLKGGLWFGIAGAVLGMAFTAMSGTVYKIWELGVLFASMPFLRAIGIQLFNRPFEPKKKMFPRIYFSANRREEWGGMVLMLLEFLLFLLLKNDRFALILCIGGILGGAIGWVIGIYMMKVSMYPLKNGNYLLGSLQKKGMIDNWKIMENVLGAFGALGLTTGFVAGYPQLQTLIAATEKNGGMWNPFGQWQTALSWSAFALIFAGEVLLGLLYLLLIEKRKKGERFMEVAHEVLYINISLFAILCGAQRFAQLVCGFLLYWVLLLELVGNSRKLRSAKNGVKYSVFVIVVGLCILFAQIYYGSRLTVFFPLVIYTWVYFLYQLLLHDLLPHKVAALREKGKQEGGLKPLHFGSLWTVEGCKFVEIFILWGFALTKM